MSLAISQMHSICIFYILLFQIRKIKQKLDIYFCFQNDQRNIETHSLTDYKQNSPFEI